MRDDIMGRYHNALFLGDAEERVKILEDSGNMNLAYISAKLHGLEDAAQRIQIAIETNGGSVDGLLEKVSPSIGTKKAACLLQPPTPIIRATNWPTKDVPKSTLENFEAAADEYDETQDESSPVVSNNKPSKAATISPAMATMDTDTNNWDDDFDDNNGTSGITSALQNLDMDGEMGDWDDDLDLGDDMADTHQPVVDEMAELSDIGTSGDYDGGFSLPTAGRPPAACWMENSSHAAIHIAGGGASKAMQLLNRQIAVSDFSKLKNAMIGSYIGSFMSLPGTPGCGSMSIPLLLNDANGHPGTASLPRGSIKMKKLINGVRAGYKFFQGGKFNEAKAAFMSVLNDIPLVVTETKNEANEIKEMVEICREYITAIRIKSAISESANDPTRATELSAYFTHCNLQPAHLLLALRSAMGTAFKFQNFICAASFARRLLELPDMSSERNADLRGKATKVLQKSEQMARNEHKLNYSETGSFTIDCKSLNPIYTGDKSMKCSFCGSMYADDSMKGATCVTCTFCSVGVQTIGLVTSS
jgi:coatomer protein complex subunit alpha (xenin)